MALAEARCEGLAPAEPQQEPSLEALAAKLGEPEELQVLNTFIHFQGTSDGVCVLRKNNTDPPPACAWPRAFRNTSAELAEPEPEEPEPELEALGEPRLPAFSATPEPSPRAALPGGPGGLTVGAACEQAPAAAAQALAAVGATETQLAAAAAAQQAPKACLALDELVCDSPRTTSSTRASLLSALESTPPASSASVGSSPSRDLSNPLPPAAVQVMLDGDSGSLVYFSLTLRRADDIGLGLHVEPTPDNRALVVRSILNGGAVEAFNHQAKDRGGSAAAKAVQPGDKIVCVNGSVDVYQMVEEIRTNFLLKIMVVRSGPAAGELPRALAGGDAAVGSAALQAAKVAARARNLALASPGGPSTRAAPVRQAPARGEK